MKLNKIITSSAVAAVLAFGAKPALAQHTREGHSRDQGSQEHAVPRDSAPREQAPQHQAPQHQAPQQRAPQQQAPQHQAPQQQAPQQQAPQQQAPQRQGPPQRYAPQQQAPQPQAPAQPAPQANQLRDRGSRGSNVAPQRNPEAGGGGQQNFRGGASQDSRGAGQQNFRGGASQNSRGAGQENFRGGSRQEFRGGGGYDRNRGFQSRGYSSRLTPRYRRTAPFRFYTPRLYRPGLSLDFGIFFGSPYRYSFAPSYGYDNSYGYGYDNGYYSTVQPGVAYGAISFRLSPGDADVYVDDTYVGIADDFADGRQPLSLAAGRHRVELAAQGYEPTAFDVDVIPGQVIPYQGTLRPGY